MTAEQIKHAIAAVLTTALETEPAHFPESMGYIAIGCDIHAWTGIKNLMADACLATFEGNEIRLTERGRTLARELDGIMKAAAKKRADLQEANAHRTPDFESYREECKARATETKHPADIAAYRDANAVRETPDTYTAEPPTNPKVEGETFYRAEGNAFGITHVKPANTGMSYGLTEAGHVALIDNPSGTCVIRAILATFPTLAAARADFYRRQDNARNGGTIHDATHRTEKRDEAARIAFGKACNYGADNDNHWTDLQRHVEELHRITAGRYNEAGIPPWMAVYDFITQTLAAIETNAAEIRAKMNEYPV